MLKVNKGRGCVYLIKYNLIWETEYKLNENMKKKLIEILNKISLDNKFEILEININLEYIHLIIECNPQHYIPDIIKALKGVSARLLIKEFNEIKKENGHLWKPCYYVSTINENIEEQIKIYINRK